MQDNNIDFWRNFVAEYYTPNAKKRWCVSLYGSGRQTAGGFPQVYCSVKPCFSNFVFLVGAFLVNCKKFHTQV